MVIGSDGRRVVRFRLPTHLVRYCHLYASLLILVFALLLQYVSSLSSREVRNHYAERLDAARALCAQIDVDGAYASFATIDSALLSIHRSLSSRGLSDICPLMDTRTCVRRNAVGVCTESTYYAQQLLWLDEALRVLPFGYPYRGRVTSEFGHRQHPITGRASVPHEGIDLQGRVGDRVRTTADGVVEFAGYKSGYGQCILIRHRHRLATLYAHLSRIDVRSGERVECGQPIGAIGSTGMSTGPHLHYEVIRSGRPVNPRDYLSLNIKSHEIQKQEQTN